MYFASLYILFMWFQSPYTVGRYHFVAIMRSVYGGSFVEMQNRLHCFRFVFALVTAVTEHRIISLFGCGRVGFISGGSDSDRIVVAGIVIGGCRHATQMFILEMWPLARRCTAIPIGRRQRRRIELYPNDITILKFIRQLQQRLEVLGVSDTDNGRFGPFRQPHFQRAHPFLQAPGVARNPFHGGHFGQQVQFNDLCNVVAG